MTRYLIVPPLLVFLALRSFAQDEPAVQDTQSKFTLIKKMTLPINESYSGYIDQYKDVAISEMYRTGIPAGITLAQAVLESGGGTSELAQQANNHFGIKCGANWYGKTYEKLDDEKDSLNNPTKSCFRKYDKAEESFFDHSEFICAPGKFGRYGFLFKLDQTDYEGWACGLEAAGYATDEGYAEKLIDLIKRYSLFCYDSIETQTRDSVQKTSRIREINRVQVVNSRYGERLEDIALSFGFDAAELVVFNEGVYTPGLPLPINSRVYLEKKRKRWHGTSIYHIVQERQAMFDVAQQYGIQLEALLKRNGLTPGQEPAPGEQVRLRGHALFSGTNIRLRKTDSGVDAFSEKQGTD